MKCLGLLLQSLTQRGSALWLQCLGTMAFPETENGETLLELINTYFSLIMGKKACSEPSLLQIGNGSYTRAV